MPEDAPNRSPTAHGGRGLGAATAKRRFLEIETSDLRVSVAARPKQPHERLLRAASAYGGRERRRALFKGVSTQFGQSNVEKYFEKT